jgi:general secretion pathway protein A
MHVPHFALTEPSLLACADRRLLVQSDSHRLATAHLMHALRGSGGLVVLTGDAGVGKTTAVNRFVRSLPESWCVALVSGDCADAGLLLRRVCGSFRVTLSAAHVSVKGAMDAHNSHLLQLHASGRQALLIVDDAHALPPQLLELMRQLNNLETADLKLLQIVLVGRTALSVRLNEPGMEQLAQRVMASHHMTALSAKDVRSYVQTRLEAAGAQANPVFRPAALRRLHRLSGGVPRIINLLSERALTRAQALGLKALGRKDINLAADAILPLRRQRRQQMLRWGMAALCLAMLVGGMTLALKPWWLNLAPNTAKPRHSTAAM